MMDSVLAIFRAYAAVGLLVSLTAHVVSIFGYQPGGNALFFLLHAGIFPLWFFVVFIINKMGNGMPRRSDYWKIIFMGCPPWMKYMTQGFFAYAIINFVLFIVTVPKGKLPAGAPPASVWHGFSGHWMVFYSAGLATLTTAHRLGWDKLSPRCPKGHAVSAADAFCPTCGAKIPDRITR